jgi:hypothetical protein
MSDMLRRIESEHDDLRIVIYAAVFAMVATNDEAVKAIIDWGCELVTDRERDADDEAENNNI